MTTALATTLLVGLRLSYHAYLGIAILPVLLWAWLTVRIYRQTRLLLPIILTHIAHNMTAPVPAGQIALIGVGLLLLAITRGPNTDELFGFTTKAPNITGETRFVWQPIATPTPR